MSPPAALRRVVGVVMAVAWLFAAPTLCSPAEVEEVACLEDFKLGARADAGRCARDCTSTSNRSSVFCLPRAVVIGSAKAGSKEVQLWLGTHPQVRFTGGEPKFFAFSDVNSFADTYLRRFPVDGVERPQDIVTMEKSPAYSQRFCTAAPAIKQLLPSVRLVYLLRDPVARAYSGFHQHCRQSRLVETATEVVRCDAGGARRSPSAVCRLPEGGDAAYTRLHLSACDAARFHKFLMGKQRRWESANRSEKALREVSKRACTLTEPYLEDDVLAHGLYSLAAQEFLRHFDRTQLHVGFHEQFVSDPTAFIGQIEDHIGVPRHEYKMHQANGFWVLDGVAGRSKAVTHNTESHEPMSIESLRFLADFYAAEVETLKLLFPEHQQHFDAWQEGWARKLQASSP